MHVKKAFIFSPLRTGFASRARNVRSSLMFEGWTRRKSTSVRFQGCFLCVSYLNKEERKSLNRDRTGCFQAKYYDMDQKGILIAIQATTR